MSELNRKNNFIIIDTDDKKEFLNLLKEITTSLLFLKFQNIKIFINTSRSKKKAQLKLYQQIADIYEQYEAYLEKNNLVDFDDLLLFPYKILKDNQKLGSEETSKNINILW